MPHEYVANGRRIALSLEHDYLAVRFHPETDHGRRSKAAAGAGLGPYEHRIELPGERFTLHPVAHHRVPREKRHAVAAERAAAHADVHRVAPVFGLGRMHVVATDRIVIGLRPGSDGIAETLDELGATVVERHEDELLVELHHAHDPLAACARLLEHDAVEFAEPDFVTLGHHSPKRSAGGGNGASGGSQYALEITRAIEAWREQPGDPEIRIAILDEGVQTGHPCLASALVATYDAARDDQSQEPEPWDAHGTACAGLAAALGDGDGGVRGIARGCSLMSARIGYTPTEAGRFVTKQWWVKRSIDWAWRNGAHVLSNSWGGVPESTAIANALERARTRGRAGRGCVIVAAAGNEEVRNGRVDFPGSLPNVLTVAASNAYDEPKTTRSRDGERWWGSSYGPEVDVAAPGVDNQSTDNMGAPGFTDDDYVPDFNGTSSATPIVAGAAALVLSANPDLPEAEVRRIIRETADKVGPVPYVDGRNDHMGYGRVNVQAAVRAALATRTVGSGS